MNCIYEGVRRTKKVEMEVGKLSGSASDHRPSKCTTIHVHNSCTRRRFVRDKGAAYRSGGRGGCGCGCAGCRADGCFYEETCRALDS